LYKLHYPTPFFCELKSAFFHRFSASYNDSVLSFFPARQVPEKIITGTENALIDSKKIQQNISQNPKYTFFLW
jgi:hypothetical protein